MRCLTLNGLFLLATVLNTIVGADQKVPVASAAPSSPPQFAVLKQPVKIKIVYGETVIPAGTRLPVVSVDSTALHVKYLGDVQTIPITAVQLESAPVDQHLPASPTAVVAPKPNAPQLPAAATPQITVALQAGWDTRMQGGDITMRELESILSRYCAPGVDLSGANSELYNGVRYLMDADQAIRVLGLSRSIQSHGQVVTPGFPRSSLSFSTFDGMFEGQFNRLDLVTDIAKRVVCIQMVDEHPRSSDLPNADDTWSTYNFIHLGWRASDTMKVAIRSEREGDVIQIEARLFQTFRQRVGRSVTVHTEEKQKTKLLLPIPLARIILHCAQTGLSK